MNDQLDCTGVTAITLEKATIDDIEDLEMVVAVPAAGISVDLPGEALTCPTVTVIMMERV